MKESELRKHTRCTVCKRLIGHTGLPLFWTVTIKRYNLKMDAIRQQDGLTTLMGGNARIAQTMGTDAEMTETLIDVELAICDSCVSMGIPIVQLAEGTGADI